MATKVTDDFFEYGVHKYFRGNAHLVELGTYGQKKDPIGPKASLDPQNKVQRVHLVNRITKGHPIEIVWGEAKKADVEVNGPIPVYGVVLDTATGYSFEELARADLKLLNLFIAEGPLTVMLNQDADGARKYLANEGNDARIVTETWVVMKADLAEHFETSSSLEVREAMTDLEVIAKGGKKGTQKIVLSAGTTFAYKLHKVKQWNKDKTKIEQGGMEADYKGLS